LTAEKSIADFVDETVKLGASPKMISNWTMGEVMRLLNERNIAPEDSPISPEQLATLIKLVEGGKINNNQAKQVFC
ncbi:MAG TPA: Asp-tRNA(Asn)/Glu-tRNA(Gln) amidotransferase GatCAB subunit B, partial [Armatimonadota bacterium]|nr:Asp-tRNA(Asn)/Glu-tRNA(Gln) amidotransferase GatCAB subunit B [Armatimonadota bacterium]